MFSFRKFYIWFDSFHRASISLYLLRGGSFFFAFFHLSVVFSRNFFFGFHRKTSLTFLLFFFANPTEELFISWRTFAVFDYWIISPCPSSVYNFSTLFPSLFRLLLCFEYENKYNTARHSDHRNRKAILNLVAQSFSNRLNEKTGKMYECE